SRRVGFGPLGIHVLGRQTHCAGYSPSFRTSISLVKPCAWMSDDLNAHHVLVITCGDHAKLLGIAALPGAHVFCVQGSPVLVKPGQFQGVSSKLRWLVAARGESTFREVGRGRSATRR